MPKTLASRIFFTFSALLAILLFAGARYADQRIERFHIDEVETRLDTSAQLLEREAALVLLDDSPKAQRAFDANVREVAARCELRVTLIGDDGTVRADSRVELPLDNHGGRPEVVEARDTGRGVRQRHSDTTGDETIYLARRLVHDDRLLGFLRISTAVERVDVEASFLRSALTLGLIGVLVLGLVGSAIVSRYLARPLERIQQSATSLASDEEGAAFRPVTGGSVEVRELATSLDLMSRKLRGRLESLRRSHRETEAILSAMREGVIAVSPEEKVLLMNDAAAHLLGLPRPLEPGHELWRVVRFPDLEHAIRSVLAGATSRKDDMASPRADGTTLSVSVESVKPRVGAVAILSDVTAIRRLEQVRMDFVANVSHEMRTPLAAVLGAIDSLEADDCSVEEQNRFHDIARRNALRMQLIVADLLELSHIEAEGDRMTLSPTAIDRPVRNSITALSGAAEKKGLTLKLVPPDLPIPRVKGNVKRLEQVFTNLIDNAIKYTPEGGSITVRFEEDESSIHVEVEDTGLGIPQESLPRVFERFYRVDQGRSRAMGGTGLGLAIVKHAARAHGGRVSVRSEEGRGTTFTVTLPRFEPERSRPVPVENS